MGEIDYAREKCWKIPHRIRREYSPSPEGWVSTWSMIGDPPQGTLDRSKIKFPAMHLSYEDYELLGNLIDEDRVHGGLSGQAGGMYDYHNGEAEFWFRSVEDAKAHYDRLVEKGFLHSEELVASRSPGI